MENTTKPWNEGMEELIYQAEREGKWLRSPYQDLWFSPRELRTAQADGRFRWGVVNWELRDPKENLKELDKEIEKLRLERSALLDRMGVRA